ncbi:hypothetical protein B0H13DRAFT_1909690 [Mycena leptocephala]|nr:hypothetical protein B0H13DRAFT_1909690 [Mycena leptocephala]
MVTTTQLVDIDGFAVPTAIAASWFPAPNLSVVCIAQWPIPTIAWPTLVQLHSGPPTASLDLAPLLIPSLPDLKAMEVKVVEYHRSRQRAVLSFEIIYNVKHIDLFQYLLWILVFWLCWYSSFHRALTSWNAARVSVVHAWLFCLEWALSQIGHWELPRLLFSEFLSELVLAPPNMDLITGIIYHSIKVHRQDSIMLVDSTLLAVLCNTLMGLDGGEHLDQFVSSLDLKQSQSVVSLIPDPTLLALTTWFFARFPLSGAQKRQPKVEKMVMSTSTLLNYPVSLAYWRQTL